MEKTRKKLTVQNQMTAQMNSLSLQIKRRIVKLLILALQSNHQFQRKVTLSKSSQSQMRLRRWNLNVHKS